MISIYLSPGDLDAMRFAFSPLPELMMSYEVLYHKPEQQSLYRGWVDEASRALYGFEFAYMDAAIAPRYIVDFLTPTPTSTMLTIEDEIARLRAVPDHVIRKNMEIVIKYTGTSDIRQNYLAYPRESVECLIEEIQVYWKRALSHHWTHINSILEDEILYRGRQLALHGVEETLSDLSDGICYEKNVIKLLKKEHRWFPNEYTLDGSGIQLVPMVFKGCGVSWQIVPEWEPMIIYQARGTGLWYQPTQPDPEETLVLALGEGRARVLQALLNPTNTGDLALRLNLTAGAVSQQLGRLTQAGLVQSHRSGNRVYYRLSQRGEKLLNIFME
jgi:DNA-binding HxlR family transcriptional regulator